MERLRDRRQAAWTLDAPVEPGGDLILPDGLTYLPGRRAIAVLSWDGLVCHPGRQYREKGEPGQPSDRLELLFAAPVGSEFSIHIEGHAADLPLAPPDAVHDPDPTLPGADLARRVDALEQQLSTVVNGAAYAVNPTAQPSTPGA